MPHLKPVSATNVSSLIAEDKSSDHFHVTNSHLIVLATSTTTLAISRRYYTVTTHKISYPVLVIYNVRIFLIFCYTCLAKEWNEEINRRRSDLGLLAARVAMVTFQASSLTSSNGLAMLLSNFIYIYTTCARNI